MTNPVDPLVLDAAEATEHITKLLQQSLSNLQRSGAIIGLSGGLDSTITAYLTVRCLGADQVKLLYLPDRDSKTQHRRDAEFVARQLGVELVIQDITPLLSVHGVYDLLPLRFVPGTRLKELAVFVGKSLTKLGKNNDWLTERMHPAPNSHVAKGNAYACIKHRMRMLILYYHAEIENRMVVGAANKTESLTGTFSHWGCDQCADVMPLLHLFRSQLPTLAAYLDVPLRIRSKTADPDVIPGVEDKEALLGSFATVDHILWGLENQTPLNDLNATYGFESVQRVTALRASSRFMRETPYVADRAQPELT